MPLGSKKVYHPSGIFVETPLLIPSFSSKGFSFKASEESEVVDALKASKEFLTESTLFSAYDLFYNHIPFDEEFLTTELIMIDSGGYETSGIYDLSATSKYDYPIKEWSVEKLEDVLSRFPSHKAGIIVSYDHGNERQPLDKQIADAKALKAKFPTFMFNFLIKPEKTTQMYVDFDNVLGKIKELSMFSIIGITEKELGNSVLNRMKNIHRLRETLDRSHNTAPIHVFGSLDPITSLLYFLAGAEVFDGLTWLKYSYYHGSAIYQSNYGVLSADLGIHVLDSKVRAKSIVNNIYFLEKMKYIMKEFTVDGDFKKFDELGAGIGSILEKSFNTFKTSL